MDDPDNRQNKNAGNGGDLVKHTVYLMTLDFLLERRPWSHGMHLRECHAGRGIYHIPSDHGSRPLLSCLCSSQTATNVIPLARTQRDVLQGLGCWPDVVQNVEWYAGSALINARRLADHPGSHTLDYYEREPETQRVLRCALTQMQLPARVPWTVLSDKSDRANKFDGEAYIEREVATWGTRDLILLDPFAMWLSPDDQVRRDRYGRIFNALVQQGPDAPSLSLFWTWGSRHQAEAMEDLNNVPRDGVNSGYHGLRAKLHQAGLSFVRVQWCWKQWFAIWVVAPSLSTEDITELARRLQADCDSVTVPWERCGHTRPRLEVKVDRP